MCFCRYGHPTGRPHYPSGLDASAFIAIVLSYFRHGLWGLPPKVGGWSWSELHGLNAAIDWGAWEAQLPALLESQQQLSQQQQHQQQP